MMRYDGGPPERRWPASRVAAWVLALVVAGGAVYIYQTRGGVSAPADPDALSPELAAALACAGVPSTTGAAAPTPSVSASPGGSVDGCHGAGGGPVAADFVNIVTVLPAQAVVAPTAGGGSAGSFVAECGRNDEAHRNSDNFITSLGIVNGAHHVHDYVGNVTTNGLTTNESLAVGATTCRLGDQSTYFWPVLRRIALVGDDADADGGGRDHNVGDILTADSVRLEFAGNAGAAVAAMPRFLRVITGDAKATTNGPANARAQWTCLGLGDRVTTTQYPICPNGTVQRILDFPSCWNGVNLDSANHRTHIGFPDGDGLCAAGTIAVPRLRMTLSYTVPPGRSFAVDSFPEQLHKPNTDHGDFVNVMPDALMAQVVACINSGRPC